MSLAASEYLPSPSAGELDVLGVLWEEQLLENRPLKLSEIHKRVCLRRLEQSDPEPALTTVSTHLRSLLAKGLIQEVLAPSRSSPRPNVRTRGMLTPSTRSPLTGYLALYPPGDVLLRTMHGLIVSYPVPQRVESLLDFGRALGLSKKNTEKLKQLVEDERKLRQKAQLSASSTDTPPASSTVPEWSPRAPQR
jgi:predicted transcriptional regulator